MIPANFQVEPELFEKLFGNKDQKIRRNFFDEIKPELDEAGIKYIDLLEAMKSTPGRYFPRNGEVHCNAAGHKFTAEAIKHYLDDEGWNQAKKEPRQSGIESSSVHLK